MQAADLGVAPGDPVIFREVSSVPGAPSTSYTGRQIKGAAISVVAAGLLPSGVVVVGYRETGRATNVK